MKRKVAFVGTLVSIVVLGMIALLWAVPGPSAAPTKAREIAVEKVTENTGWSADLTGFPVLRKGKKLEDRKTLRLLGKKVYLNRHLLFRAGKDRDPSVEEDFEYSFAADQELRLMFSDLLLHHGLTGEKAFQRMADFVETLPDLECAGFTWDNTTGGMTIVQPELDFRYGSGFDANRAEFHGRAVPEEERQKASAGFRSIVTAMEKGKTLVVKERGYGLR